MLGLEWGLEYLTPEELVFFLERYFSAVRWGVLTSSRTCTGKAWMHMDVRLKLMLRTGTRVAEKLHLLLNSQG